MSLFPWALIFVALSLASVGLLTLVGFRLWHNVKALGQDTAKLGSSLAQVGSLDVARSGDRDD